MTSDVSRVSGRFVATCGELGFVPPPTDVRAKILFLPSGGTLFIQPESDFPVGAVVEWLAPTQPRGIEFGSKRVLRVSYATPPPAWAICFEGVSVHMLNLKASGAATVDVLGTRRAIQAFDARLRDRSERIELVDVRPQPSGSPFMTAPQESALRGAVAAGYYRIPRPLNLHQLAMTFGVTAASLSERLRRAEGRVLTHYVEVGLPQAAYITGGASTDDWGFSDGSSA